MKFEETPLVIILGQSGRGKSTSIRNLPVENTVILNTEQKPLPFKGSSKFKHNYKIGNPDHLVTGINKFKDDDSVDVVVIDSFSAWTDLLMEKARNEYKNFDIFNYYNKTIYKLFKTIKDFKKIVILIAHDEVVQTADGETIKSVKVKGKEWEGVIEKEAIVVLYARMIKDKEGKNQYFFETQTDGVTSAKSPMDMFEQTLIPNDLNLVIKGIKEYYE